MSLEEFREVMTEDCDYRNIPIDGDRHIGPEAAHVVLSTMGVKWNVDLTVVNLVGDDKVVLTERTEHFSRKDASREPFEPPVMGVFELRDGRGRRVAGLLRAELTSASADVDPPASVGPCVPGVSASEGDVRRPPAPNPPMQRNPRTGGDRGRGRRGVTIVAPRRAGRAGTTRWRRCSVCRRR